MPICRRREQIGGFLGILEDSEDSDGDEEFSFEQDGRTAGICRLEFDALNLKNPGRDLVA